MEKKVHIINMSFSLPDTPANLDVGKLIRKVSSGGIIFIAAATSGVEELRAFPCKMPQVLCIHSTDGNRNSSSLNPESKGGTKNFASLGVAIKSEWGAEQKYLEGTSYAAPIVAGIICNILRFVRYSWRKQSLNESIHKEVFSIRGVSSILASMTILNNDGYDYLGPSWRELWKEDEDERDFITKIKSAVKEGMEEEEC